MRRPILIAAVVLGVLVLLVAVVIGLQPIGHRWDAKGYTEPTCAEYDAVCNEGCRVRDSGADCYACCAQAKGECVMSGDYLAHLKQCFVAQAVPSK